MSCHSNHSQYFSYVLDGLEFVRVQTDIVEKLVLHLTHTGALLFLGLRTNSDIPKDWNVFIFHINHIYIDQGTLDGRVVVR